MSVPLAITTVTNPEVAPVGTVAVGGTPAALEILSRNLEARMEPDQQSRKEALRPAFDQLKYWVDNGTVVDFRSGY